MLAYEKKLPKYPREIAGGAIYTVDEVSGLLGIPRPTLYRYLREYSIPHLRREGRISIPEDSFDRIRRARDLHKEGLGTESVRRQLREGRSPDSQELDRRLDSLHRTMEGLRGDIRERPVTEDLALSPTLRTILARQSLLMSAVFNLTEMVEELLLASGKPRKPLFQDLEASEALSEGPQAGDRLGIPGRVAFSVRTLPTRSTDRFTDFGVLRRRRRRYVLVLVATLLLLASLAWAVPAMVGNAEPLVPRVADAVDGPGRAPRAIAIPQETRVPDVSGRRLRAAVGMISDAGFEVEAIETEASFRHPRTAIRTEPMAGVLVKPGAPVVLTISAGPAVATSSASATASASAGYTN